MHIRGHFKDQETTIHHFITDDATAEKSVLINALCQREITIFDFRLQASLDLPIVLPCV